MTKLTVGRKPTTESLSERLAFNDPDRTTPLHDDICLWLDGWLRSDTGLAALTDTDGRTLHWTAGTLDAAAREVMSEAKSQRARCKSYSDWAAKADLDEWNRKALGADLDEWNRKALAEAHRWCEWTVPEAPPLGPPRVLDITWELTVGTEKWVSGFIDIAATISVPWRPQLATWMDAQGKEAPPEKWDERRERRAYAFEVKSVIPSLGELIRQVRYYQSKHQATYYVVAPDDTHKDTLHSQRIGFIHYPSGEVTRV